MSTLMDQLKQNVESKKNRDVEIFTLSEEVKNFKKYTPDRKMYINGKRHIFN